jgi:hypothetical protein
MVRVNTLAQYTVLVIVASREATSSWNWGANAEPIIHKNPRRQ